jgi:hypothetical protein
MAQLKIGLARLGYGFLLAAIKVVRTCTDIQYVQE